MLESLTCRTTVDMGMDRGGVDNNMATPPSQQQASVVLHAVATTRSRPVRHDGVGKARPAGVFHEL